MNDLFSNLGNVVTTVCALGCFCVGGIVLVGGFFAIRVGGQFLPIVGDLFTGGRSEGGSDPVMAQGVSSRSAGNSIRQRAQLLKAQDPLGSPYQSQAYQAQSAPPAVNSPIQRTEFPAFNAQAASPAPTGQTGLLPPTRATGQFGQIGRQPTAPQAAPQGNNYPPMQPPANNYPPMQPPPAAPLGGIPRRPTLSTGRPVSPLDNTQGQNTSDLDMRFSTNEIPGLRNRRRRSGDQEIYDDQEDASGDAGILGGMENFLGGF